MKQELTHLSLFTGIGGIDLAAEWAGFTTVAQCEYAEYPTKILEKHWPNVQRWRDVRDVTAESFRYRTGIKEPTIISGGFPCQPHSFAGKRKASYDERDLWHEFARVICEIKPKWVLGENVLGLLSSENGRFFGRVLGDLAQMGYSVGWCCYPAAWVGAIHRRERLFIIANADGKRWNSMEENQQKQSFRIIAKEFDHTKAEPWIDDESHNLLRDGERALFVEGGCAVRNDNGLSEGMDRISCLGNAVMPQQIYPILKTIAEIEINEVYGYAR